jgi:hypothetical protein
MIAPAAMFEPRLVRAVRRLALACLFPALAVVLWGELGPVSGLPGVSDKLQHATAYFGLAVLTTMAFRGRAVLYAAVGLVLMGALVEFLQQFVGRDSSVLDALANTAGFAVGWAAGVATNLAVGLLADMPLFASTADGGHPLRDPARRLKVGPIPRSVPAGRGLTVEQTMKRKIWSSADVSLPSAGADAAPAGIASGFGSGGEGGTSPPPSPRISAQIAGGEGGTSPPP